MNNIRLASLFVAALFMGSLAQAQQAHVKASVPFSFVAGNITYLAGEYEIQRVSDNLPALRIESTGEVREATMVLSNSCSSNKPSETSKLVFHRVGDTYFLYQIWTQGSLTGREFPVSKREIKMASNQSKTDLVIVAANLVK
jgi:hypothetical protein